MAVEIDTSPTRKRDPDDLNKVQDKNISKIREKERPGLIKRIIALLRYFFKPDYLV
jgi:hypothetical protein